MSSDPKQAGNGASNTRPPAKRRGESTRRNVSRTFGKGAYVESSAERHQGRVLAMQALFEFDTTDHELEILARVRGEKAILPDSAIESIDEDETAVDDVPREVARHAAQLARGVVAKQGEIDPIIEKSAPAFPIDQIAAVDRNVLRLAIYELYNQDHVPVRVAINEAVEIAKRYGGPNSSKFVNGVLGTISKQLPAERHLP